MTLQFVFFDLDGTLIDTAGEITEATNRALAMDNISPLPRELVQNWIGKGTAWLFSQALESATGEGSQQGARFQRLYPEFLKQYEIVTGQLSEPFSDMEKVLALIKKEGVKLGVVTNKERSLTLQLLDHLNLTHYFDVVVAGGDAKRGKPYPDPLLLALEKAGVDRSGILFVGDSINDVEAARAAQISIWAFTHGYNHGLPISEANPDRVINGFNDLYEQLKTEFTFLPIH
ncbi:phosphoglycolate phosphatase [Ferrovum sp. PN-J185]|uniref:phosphoglycolate phosphatase n=1 Tax=Ferrovum sp. PN-J185 TaxID=1356306 RepID=UPI0007977FB8|nr:phosphoglycolate phosphatase [Ferrovum sp. PN-J185]KXW56606.1 phosphoglycolate phosphatase [Ferrovum sp. PN-J185]MCC6068345.1 phosphoglycolate phosphatase [Ferrovum sp. PN-J185]